MQRLLGTHASPSHRPETELCAESHFVQSQWINNEATVDARIHNDLKIYSNEICYKMQKKIWNHRNMFNFEDLAEIQELMDEGVATPLSWRQVLVLYLPLPSDTLFWMLWMRLMLWMRWMF